MCRDDRISSRANGVAVNVDLQVRNVLQISLFLTHVRQKLCNTVMHHPILNGSLMVFNTLTRIECVMLVDNNIHRS